MVINGQVGLPGPVLLIINQLIVLQLDFINYIGYTVPEKNIQIMYTVEWIIGYIYSKRIIGFISTYISIYIYRTNVYFNYFKYARNLTPPPFVDRSQDINQRFQRRFQAIGTEVKGKAVASALGKLSGTWQLMTFPTRTR